MTNISRIFSVQAIRGIFFVKSKCCHSFRKHDQPHTLQIALCILSGEVRSACCSCVAGKVGFCNHVLALMFKLCKFLLFNCSTTKDLSEEDDEHVPLACTSQLQQWHKKGGGANIMAYHRGQNSKLRFDIVLSVFFPTLRLDIQVFIHYESFSYLILSFLQVNLEVSSVKHCTSRNSTCNLFLFDIQPQPSVMRTWRSQQTYFAIQLCSFFKLSFCYPTF